MRILKTMLKQRGVYWPPTEADGNGVVGFGTPVELKMRWEDAFEEQVNKGGQMLTAVVRCFVQTELTVGGALWLAPKATWRTAGAALAAVTDYNDPHANEGALIIISFSRLPTLRKPQEALMVALM